MSAPLPQTAAIANVLADAFDLLAERLPPDHPTLESTGAMIAKIERYLAAQHLKTIAQRAN
jgi:hypothetical protein